MKMEGLPSGTSYCDDDRRSLEQLLEAFGSVVSLEDIASAYCQADRDVYTAGEILCSLQGGTSRASTSTSKDELDSASASSEWSSDNISWESHAERNFTLPKPKKLSVSMGTISGVIGREYARPRPLTREPYKVTKPLKLKSSELPASEIWVEEVPLDIPASGEPMHKDVEEFLFTMLGDGFQLDMNVIREVLGHCGHDIGKSMDKLLDLSAFTLEKSDDVLSKAAQKPMEKCLDLESLRCQEKSQYRKCSESGGETRFITRNESELPKRDKDRYDLEKEILEALFSVPERFEEAPKKILPAQQFKRSRAFGHLVVEPLKDPTKERRIVTAKPQVTEGNEEENEDSYEVLRKAVKDYWITMKDYYKAAVDAFAKGDQAHAYKFLEEGQFFMKRAREADDKSAQKLLETRDDEEEVCLDLHDHEPKEAIRLMKFHLTSLSGISSIQYLKVIVGTDDNDTKEAARKRRILKLLDRDSLTWTEEGNGQTIVIRVDKINPKCLSFAKKAAVEYK